MKLKITAIIATRNRPFFLKRALFSIFEQNYHVTEVIIINDSNRDYFDKTNTVINKFSSKLNIKKIIAPNPGNPCKSWNEGAKLAKGNFLAFLDDDDEWLPNYILKCVELQQKGNLDLVLAGFWRKKNNKSLKPDFLPPHKLSEELLYIQNIGLRTSNLFIRKKVFLAVGGFDESLKTSTDRGLGLRLAKHNKLSYMPLKDRLVIYNKHKKEQMISAKNPTRYLGTMTFFEKFSKKMTVTQQRFFLYRTLRFWGFDFFEKYAIQKYKLSKEKLTKDLEKLIFKWIDRESNTVDLHEYYHAAYNQYLDLLSKTHFDKRLIDIWQIISRQFEEEYQLYHAIDRRPIVIGMVNTNRSIAFKNFVNSLLNELYIYGLNGYMLNNPVNLRIIIIDNSSIYEEKELTKKIVYLANKCGLTINYFEALDCLNENPSFIKKTKNKLPFSIAESRRILNQKLISLEFPRKSIFWILDDCMQFGSLIVNREGMKKHHIINTFNLIWSISEKYPDKKILIGENTGTAPLPVLSTIVNQLYDLKKNIEMFEKEKANLIYTSNYSLNIFNKRNYYHDFLFNKKTTYPYLQEIGTNLIVFTDYLKGIKKILLGLPITRPLVIANVQKFSCKNINQITILRGGNTIIYDSTIIKENHHPLPFFKEELIRRSDMIWTIEMLEQNTTSYISPIILHKQKPIKETVSDDNYIDILIQDIYGHVLYKWLLNGKSNERILRRIYKRRISKIKDTLKKGRLLIKEIKNKIQDPKYWWTKEINFAVIKEATKALEVIDVILYKTQLELSKLKEPTPNDFTVFFETERKY